MTRLPVSMRPWALVLASSLALVACSSTPLNEAPVSNGSASTSTTTTGPQAQSAVAPVAANSNVPDLAGPPGAARVIYFDYDSSAIKPEFQSTVDAHARFMESHRDRKLTIAGNTDERGGSEYNLALGQRRAQAVADALHLLGVPENRMEAISWGKEKPVATGHDEAAWAQNRRAELSYK